MAVSLDLSDALRYLGGQWQSLSSDWQEEARRMAEIAVHAAQPRTVHRIFALQKTESGFGLQGSSFILQGNSARVMLQDCTHAALFACTLGTGFDLALRQWQQRDMAKAVILDACGSALIEAICDQEEKKILDRMEHFFLTDRFSPGYGDLPLSLQPDLLMLLDAFRRTGITLTDTCMMNPGKSVSAVIGISPRPQKARIRGCAFCSLHENCQYRKGGKTCGTEETPSA